MILRYKPTLARLAVLVGFASLVGTTSVKAQAWADSNYAFRRPLTIINSSPQPIATGDIIAFGFTPATGALAKARTDGKDVKVVYYNGSANVNVPQTSLAMGLGNAKILFEAQAPIGTPPPRLAENASAGSTGYASLPAGALITPADINGDDGGSTITLPFAFPFGDVTTDKVYFSIDGYLVPGPATAMSQYGRGNTGKPGIYPYTSDYTVQAAKPEAVGAAMYYYGDATQAIFRWEVAESGQTAVIAKFAAILKPDGTIRFVYSDTVTPTSAGNGGPGSYGEMCYGVVADTLGNGIIHFPTDNFPTSAILSNHADILYTQSWGGAQSTGYYAYYGNTLDDGVTGRTPPAANKVVMYNFDDDTTQGWVKADANTETTLVEAATFNSQKTLHVQTTGGGHPAAIAAAQTAVLGDATVYSKIAAANSDEVGIGVRCNGLGNGYFNVLDGFGSLQAIVERTTPGGTKDYNIISNTTPFVTAVWSYDMMRVTGTGADIALRGRAWVDGAMDPGTWTVSGAPSLETSRYDTGVLGITGYGGDKYIDWICATGPNAELTTNALGTEEGNPTGATILGVVRDITYRVLQPGTKITVMTASGAFLASTATDANGAYAVYFPTSGTYGIAALGGGRSARAVVTIAPGGVVTQDLMIDVVANGDCEVPTADGLWPDQWETYQFSAGGAPDIAALSNEQNHTPGGHWSLKIAGVKGDSTSFQTGIGRTGNQLFQHPILPGCSYTLSGWVYFTNSGDQIRFRLRNGWPIAGFFVKAGAAPDVNNENTGGLDGNGLVPVGQWYQFKRTWTYTPGGTANPLPIEYGIYTFAAQTGSVYLDDVTLTPTPVSLNLVVAKVVDTLGNPVASPYVGEMRYGDTLFSLPIKANEVGIARFLTTNSSAVSLAPWVGPASRVPTNISPEGRMVGAAVSATPVAYDPNLTTPFVTLVWQNKAAQNILGAGTVGLVYGTSKWSSYLIDKRIDKTGVTDPGDSTNINDWVQVRRNSTGDADTVDGQEKVARLWDGNIDGEWNGLGTGGMRGVMSKDGGTDIPDRYRTSTIDIDMGNSWPIDQLELGYFFQVNKHRVWISNTPFTWNVELSDAQAVINTTTDATSVAAQGFPSSDMPYAQQQAGPYQVYRFGTPVTGRYMRIRQDGAPYGDGHQIPLEFRALSQAANPQPVHGRVVDSTSTPVAGAFVGPFPAGSPGDYVKTDANGFFTWYGPGIPTTLGVHIEAKKSDNTYDTTPYLLTTLNITPAVGGTELGDVYVFRSTGNAMLGATSMVVANDGAPGTEAYGPSFCDPTVDGKDPSKLSDGLAGDPNQWAAKPAKLDPNTSLPCIGVISGGASYLRVGVESTLAAPADLDEIDIYWFQNGFPAGFYVQTSSDAGTTWSTVYETTNYAGNYNDAFPGDGLRVSPIKFATKTGVNKVRVIFSTLSNRGTGEDNEFIINEIVALKHAVIPITASDVKRALVLAAGLDVATAADKTRLDADGDGKVTALDAVKLNKALPH